MPTGPEDELAAVILAEARRIGAVVEPRVNAEVDKLIAYTRQLAGDNDDPFAVRGILMAHLDGYVRSIGRERALDLAVALTGAVLLRLAGVKPLTPDDAP